MTLYFDMDGTIANLYADPEWLSKLRAYNPEPYANAKPLVNTRRLQRMLQQVQKNGINIGIISWLSKESNADYDREVRNAKREWLKKHFPELQFDEIHLVKYGTPKAHIAKTRGILFDDEEQNRSAWNKGESFEPKDIFEIIESLL